MWYFCRMSKRPEAERVQIRGGGGWGVTQVVLSRFAVFLALMMENVRTPLDWYLIIFSGMNYERSSRALPISQTIMCNRFCLLARRGSYFTMGGSLINPVEVQAGFKLAHLTGCGGPEGATHTLRPGTPPSLHALVSGKVLESGIFSGHSYRCSCCTMYPPSRQTNRPCLSVVLESNNSPR